MQLLFISMVNRIPGTCTIYVPRGHNPNYDIPNNQKKLMVWVGLMVDNNIIRPYFHNQPINGCIYLQMIDQYVLSGLTRYSQNYNCSTPCLRWVQDGAPAHCSAVVWQILQQCFPNHTVGIVHGIECPPSLLDLTPRGFPH